MTLRRFDEPLTKSYSLGRGKGYDHVVAFCSRCKRAAAHWLDKQGCRQRYYCDDCVKVTRAWKETAK